MTGEAERTRAQRWSHRAAMALLWLAGIGAGVLLAVWIVARPPMPDGFYDPPAGQTGAPGALLRSEPFTRGVPAGAQGWRILYATTREDGAAAVASGIVVLPGGGAGERPILAYAHGTTGIARGCAPSLMKRPFDGIPALDGVIAEGWGLVLTDYVGLGTAGGHRYLIGQEAARGMLDAARAARRLPEARLGADMVVWGHSQGGNSALWTAFFAGVYAPDLSVRGAAAFAPAGDLRGLVARVSGTTFGKIVSSYLLRAYEAVYADVAAAGYERAWTRPLVSDIAGRCVGEWPTLLSVLQAKLLPGQGIFGRDPGDGPLERRLEQNSPFVPSRAPLFIAQGLTDDLVLPDLQQGYVATLCRQGAALRYRTFPGLDHVSLVAPASPLGPEAIAWTRARFRGEATEAGCG